MPTKPHLCFIFANDYLRYLHKLPQESNDIAFYLRDKDHLCGFEIVGNSRPKDLHDACISYKDRLQVLHFGGHSDGYQLVLNNDVHNKLVFDGKGLVTLLKPLPHLHLVFINGCQSEQMLNELFDAGVPAVIGTTQKIGDSIACELSVAFYAAIAKECTISEAWEMAKGKIIGMYGKDKAFRAMYLDDDNEEITGVDAPWFLKLKKGAGEWRLKEIKEEESVAIQEANVENNGDKNNIFQNVNDSTINQTIVHNYAASTKKLFPPFHNISATPFSHEIIGRENDLTAVHALLLAHKECIVVNGIGGIGKSTLAKYYIQRFHAEYAHIIWLEEKATVEDIFLGDVQLLKNLEIEEDVRAYIKVNEPKAALECVLQALNALTKPVLLVADNVKDLHSFDRIIADLDKNAYHILLSSRQQTHDLRTHPLDYLNAAEAMDLFVLYYKGKRTFSEAQEAAIKANTDVQAILQQAHYHTLTVELLAKILANSETLDFAKVQQRLATQLINPSLKQSLHTSYTAKQASLYEIVLQAFSLSDISSQPLALTILSEWSVLPSDPIPQAILWDLLGKNEDNEDEMDTALTYLIRNGWIQKIQGTETAYFCHAIIQEAVRIQQGLGVEKEETEKVKVVKPQSTSKIVGFIKKLFGGNEAQTKVVANSSHFDFTPLMDRLALLFYHELTDNFLDKQRYLSYSNSVLAYITDATEITANLANNTAFIYGKIGNYTKQLEYDLKALTIREAILADNNPILANSYNNIASTYGSLGDNQKRLEYNLKALKIRDFILTKNHPILANSYNNIASTYASLGDNQKALEYDLMALAIREKVLAAEHPDLALSYANIAVTYDSLGNHHKSLDYHLKALTIREKVLAAKHPDLALSYANIAVTYGSLGDHQKALEYNVKALVIRETVLAVLHPNLADSYHNIAITYCDLQDYLLSLSYFQKAIQIRKKSLPIEHTDTKSSIEDMEFVLQALEVAGLGKAVAGYRQWLEEEGKGDKE